MITAEFIEFRIFPLRRIPWHFHCNSVREACANKPGKIMKVIPMLAIKKHSFEPTLETGEPDPTDLEARQQSNIIAAIFWMVGLTMALFFFPVVNGIIGGIVGGFKAGNTKGALLAALLPAGTTAFLLWMLLTVAPLPVMGGIGDIELALLVLLSELGLFLGAAIGGTVAQNKIDRLNRA
jgi:hypothetical protein